MYPAGPKYYSVSSVYNILHCVYHRPIRIAYFGELIGHENPIKINRDYRVVSSFLYVFLGLSVGFRWPCTWGNPFVPPNYPKAKERPRDRLPAYTVGFHFSKDPHDLPYSISTPTRGTKSKSSIMVLIVHRAVSNLLSGTSNIMESWTCRSI